MDNEIEILTSSKNYFNLRIAYLEELKDYIPDFAKYEFELFINELKTLPNNYYLLKKTQIKCPSISKKIYFQF